MFHKIFLKHYGIQSGKPRLTQHLGIEPSEMIIEPYSVTVDLQPDDQFLLCSDGLTDMVSPERIEEFLRRGSNPEITVDSLIKESLASGGKDNITVILCKVVS